jgi:hypothetical protein
MNTSDETAIKIFKLKPATGGSHRNPRYSGGRDQEDHGSKPALANSSRDPPSQKKKQNLT